MKKIILLLLLVLVSVTASARKSYISISYSSSGYNYLYGDIPEGLNGFEYENRHARIKNTDMSRTEILNLLTEYGYELEFIWGYENSSFILSKEIPSNQTQIEGDVNNDNEVNIADVNKVISLILGMLRDNPKLLEQLGIEQPK